MTQSVCLRTWNLTVDAHWHLMTFTHFKAYSEDLRWVLIHMHHKCDISVNEIERLTGLKSYTIRRVLKLYEGTGQVMPLAAKSGHTRKLDDIDINVSVDLIYHLLFYGHAQFLLFAVSQILHSTFWRHLSWWTTKAPRGYLPCEGIIAYHLESTQTTRIYNETGASMLRTTYLLLISHQIWVL